MTHSPTRRHLAVAAAMLALALAVVLPLAPETAFSQQAPSQMAAPALEPGGTSLTVRWAAVTGATGYKVRRSSDGFSWATTTVSGGASTSTTIGSLTAATEYQVQVLASNAQGDGPWSTSARMKPGAPAAPAAPALSPGSGRLSVTWTAPANNGSAVTDYDVQYRATGATNWTEKRLSLATHDKRGVNNNLRNKTSNPSSGKAVDLEIGADIGGVTITKPTTGGISNVYRIGSAVDALRIRMEGQDLDQEPGYVARYSTTAPASNALLTHGTKLWERGHGSQGRFTGDAWTPVDETLPAGTHFWIVAKSSSNLFRGDLLIEIEKNVTTANTSLSGLTNGTEYEVRARAANARGDGPWSPAAAMTAGAPVAPAAPTLVSGNAQLAVTWTVPSANGGTLSGFKVRYKTTATSSWTSHAFSSTGATTGTTITGLINGASYNVQVMAANERGDGPWSPSTTAQAGAPDAPAAPTLSAGNAQMSVSWSAPADNGSAITDYDVRYSSNSGAAWTELPDNTPSTALSATIGSLTNGTTYEVQVRAANARGDGAWSSSATLKSGAPATPSEPALVPGLTQITASWTVPADNGSAITDYDVRYRTSTSSTWTEWNASNTGTTASATITGLTTGTAYEVQVRATNAVGDSAWSASATSAAGAPTAPSAPTLTAVNTALGVSWSAPTNDNGSAVIDYDVRYCSTSCDAAGSWTEWNAGNTGTATSTTITVLTNGTSYRVQVRAANARGDGPWSASTTGTPATTAPAKNPTPTLVSGNQSLTATWTAPIDNGEAILDYDVRWSSDNGANWTRSQQKSTHRATYTWGNIQNSNGAGGKGLNLGGINLSGVAVSKASISGLSNIYKLGSAVETLRIRMKGDDTAYGAYYQARYSTSQPTSGNLNNQGHRIWRVVGPGSNLTGDATASGPFPANTYFWVARESDSNVRITEVIVEVVHANSATSRAITGLTNNTEYEVQVRAGNLRGYGPWSDSATIKSGLPAAPAAPALVSGNGRLSVSWTAPSSNGSDVTDYDVQYKAATASNWTDAAHTTTLTRVTITNLTNGVGYQVRVRATNIVGDGPWSPTATAIAGAPNAPGAPALASGNGQLSVSWSAPADNGSAITDYDVRYKATTASTWDSLPDVTNDTATTATIGSLTNNTEYEVQVRAGNARGDGIWSPSTRDKPGRPPAPSAPTVTGGSKQITVAWTAPAANGLAIDDYDVRYCAGTCANDSDWTEWNANDTSTTTSTTITGLRGGTTYRAQVRAASAAGDGPWSPSGSGTTSTDAPDAPSPVISSGSGQFTLSWDAPSSGGSAITDYDVRYREKTSPTPIWTEWNAADNSTTRSVTITGRTNGTTYEAQARATNAIGDSAWSTAVSVLVGAPATPAAPALASGDRRLSVSWTAPADNGDAINDYDLQMRSSGAANWTTVYDGGSVGYTHVAGQDTANQTNNPVNFGDMNISGVLQTESLSGNKGLYKALVAIDEMALNLQNTASNQFKVHTHSQAPTNDLTIGTELVAATKNFSGWVGPIDANGYFWALAVSSGADVTYGTRFRGISKVDLRTTATTYTITGLTNGSTYQVRVRAANSRGDGGWSASGTAKVGLPAAPAAPTLTSGPSKLIAEWTAPANSGSAITDYDVRSSADGSNWTEMDDSTPSTATGATVAGLTNGTTYQVQVRAANTHGDGPWSPSATLKAGAPDAPAAPALAPGDTQMTATWTAPADNGGSAVNDYDVRYSSDLGATWTELPDNTNSTELSATIVSLTNGTSYEAQVRAGNANGDGVWSSSALMNAGAPAAPAAPTLTPGDSRLTASWAAPANNGSAITDYDVRYSSDLGITWTELADDTPSTTTTATISTLTNGALYMVQARAGNANGDGPWSPSAQERPVLQTVPSRAIRPCVKGGTTTLWLNYACYIRAGEAGASPYDRVTLEGDSAHYVEQTWIAKANVTQVVAYNPNGGVATVKTWLNNEEQDTFTIDTVRFGIRSFSVSSPSASTNSSFRLTVRLNSPVHRSPAKYNKDLTTLARAWVRLALPAGSGLTGSDHARGQVSDPVQLVDQYGDTVTFTVNTGVQYGAFDIGIEAYNPGPDHNCPTEGDPRVVLRCYAPPVGSGTQNYYVHVAGASFRVAKPVSLPPDPQPLVQPPAAVSFVGAVHHGDRVVVTWAASSGATGYDLRYSTDDGATWTQAAANRSGTGYTLTGADSNAGYVFGVRAVNSDGASDWRNSNLAGYTPPENVVSIQPRPAPGPASPPPDAPESLAVEWDGGALTASWSAAAHALLYAVEYTDDNGLTWVEAASGHAETSIVIDGLEGEEIYIVRVRSRGQAGVSDWTLSKPVSAH